MKAELGSTSTAGHALRGGFDLVPEHVMSLSVASSATSYGKPLRNDLAGLSTLAAPAPMRRNAQASHHRGAGRRPRPDPGDATRGREFDGCPDAIARLRIPMTFPHRRRAPVLRKTAPRGLE